MIALNYYPYTIKLKDEFRISVNSRTETPAVLVELEYDGLTGFGEASLPPYLKETQKSVINFLEKIDFHLFEIPDDINLILDHINNLSYEDNAAKASIDIALHDLFGKIKNKSLTEFLHIPRKENLYSSITIGISDEHKLKQKISQYLDYKYLKIKLGTEIDRNIINTIRSITDKPLFIDVNQGWQDKYFALDMINWLAEKNVVLIEQPLPKEKHTDSIWLKEKSLLPIIADEAFQSINDLNFISEAYSGINIKLMKCGGIRQSWKIITEARNLGLKIMIGCMTETSCAITAASHLASLADWVDLDGAELISNDLFEGTRIEKGRIIIPESAGIGVKKLKISSL